MPTRKGGYWYYSRTVEGQQYGIHCRRAVAAGRDRATVHCGRFAAGRRGGAARRQRRGRRLGVLRARHVRREPGRHRGWPTRSTSRATSGSPCGSRTCAPGRCCRTSRSGSATARPGRPTDRPLFYLTVDEAWRPHQVWRHVLGTPTEDDVLVLEEPDERFWVGIGLSRSERVPHHRPAQQAHQRGLRDPGRVAPTSAPSAGRPAPAGRRVRGRARPGRGPVPDPAQRRGGGLRARLDPGRRARASGRR